MLRLKTPRTRQPPASVSGLARSVFGFAPPRDVWSLHNGRLSSVDGKYPLSIVGSASVGPAGTDMAAKFGSATDKLTATDVLIIGTGVPRTMLLRVRPRALTGNNEYVVGMLGSSIVLRHSSISFNWGLHDGGALRASGDVLPVAGAYYNLMLPINGTAAKFFRDGRQVGSATVTDTYWFHTGATYFNDFSTGAGLGSAADLSLCAVWDKVVPDGVCAELTRNPWALFQPQDRWMPTQGAAAGGGFSAAWVRPQSRIIGAGVR